MLGDILSPSLHKSRRGVLSKKKGLRKEEKVPENRRGEERVGTEECKIL